MFLQSTKCYIDYVRMTNKMRYRILSSLINIYPNIRYAYIRTMNPEEQILFDAKIVRLESETIIRNKCIDNIYPNSWVYTFNKEVKGREFLKRYRNIVTRMREKLNYQLDRYDFDLLFTCSVELLDKVQTFNKMKRESLELDTSSAMLRAEIEKIIEKIGVKNKEAYYGMRYLYGFISKTEFVKICKYAYDLYDYTENSRAFNTKKLVRKYAQYPCVITYLYLENHNQNSFSLIQPQCNILDSYEKIKTDFNVPKGVK